MSIFNNEPLPNMIGLTVVATSSGEDDSGYGFTEFTFDNGLIFKVEEIGQTGEIKWSTPSTHTTPR